MGSKREAFSLKMILEKGEAITGSASNLSTASSNSFAFTNRKRHRKDLESLENQIRSNSCQVSEGSRDSGI